LRSDFDFQAEARAVRGLMRRYRDQPMGLTDACLVRMAEVSEPKWISTAIATAIHDEAIYEFGGLAGIRDMELLDGALERPRNPLAYEPGASVFRLAAALCVGIAKNPPFNDGNKRTALLVTRAFLCLNAQELNPRRQMRSRRSLQWQTAH